jgi:hypothetical protein
MPDLGLEAHDRWPERVLVRDLDVYHECATLIWGVWWSIELALEVCEVIPISCRLHYYLGVLVVLDVGDFFGDTPGSIR